MSRLDERVAVAPILQSSSPRRLFRKRRRSDLVARRSSGYRILVAMTPPKTTPIAQRVAAVDWSRAREQLDDLGYARLPRLLRARECTDLVSRYPEGHAFRKRVSMEQHRFGVGEYHYFAYPLPDLVEQLRTALYRPLAAIANDWAKALGERTRYPPQHEEFLARCRRRGQLRPTPLMLHYGSGGLNHLHQDLYGSVAFPLQVTCLLDTPDRDFSGGEFLLVEGRPRQQSRGEAIALKRGEAIVFPTRERPVLGARGTPYRAKLRHGVSRVRSGQRHALGIIFHDAQ
jgi:hypothetical protein